MCHDFIINRLTYDYNYKDYLYNLLLQCIHNINA